MGINNGLNGGFSTGGVNAAYLQDCFIENNNFVDCQSIYYQDTGTAVRVHVNRNSGLRCWQGINFIASNSGAWTKADLEIVGNWVRIQNRVLGGASNGIFVKNDATTGLVCTDNNVSYQEDGGGAGGYGPLQIHGVTGGKIENNYLPEPTDFVSTINNISTGNASVFFSNNRTRLNNQVVGVFDTNNSPDNISDSIFGSMKVTRGLHQH